MKGYRLLIVAAVALMSSPLPSMAGNPNIDQHMWHARKQVQLTDESALLTDLRRQGNLSQVVVIEAPTQTQPAPPPIMIRPGQNSPGVTIIKSGLPDAGFQSSISPNSPGRMLSNLPNGMSTNLLAGKMINQGPKPIASKPAVASSAAPKVEAFPSAPKTLVYSSQPSSSGMLSRNVSTDVTGHLQRGSLLANQSHR